MKILAISTTQGSVHTLRPQTEQFIEMHRMGIHIDIMTQAGTEFANILKNEGLNIVGGFPQHKNDKEATVEIRKLLLKND
nr:hypothetical protein [Bacteroidales bacterium]